MSSAAKLSPMPSIAEVCLLPNLLQLTIPAQWQDRNGHVNVQYYLRVFDLAADPLMHLLGMNVEVAPADSVGYFDLQHHLWFLAEMHVGDSISTHCRMLGCSAKRIHGLMFIVNHTRASLSATIEFLTTGANLRTRRSAALPAGVVATIMHLAAQHSHLTWPAPRSGAIAV